MRKLKNGDCQMSDDRCPVLALRLHTATTTEYCPLRLNTANYKITPHSSYSSWP